MMTILLISTILGNISDRIRIVRVTSIRKDNDIYAQKDKMCPKMANSPKMAISTVRHQIRTKMNPPMQAAVDHRIRASKEEVEAAMATTQVKLGCLLRTTASSSRTVVTKLGAILSAPSRVLL